MVVNFNFDSYMDYVILAEKTTNKEIDQLSEKLQEWEKKNSDSEISAHDVFQNDFYRVFHFDKLAVSAGIILAYAELENGLNSISEIYGKYKKIPKQSLIDSYRSYFTSVLNITFPADFTQLLEDLSKCSLIRNRIVHDDSKLKSTDLVADFEKIAGIKLNPYRKIQIDDWNVCKRFALDSRKLLWFVIGELMDKEKSKTK